MSFHTRLMLIGMVVLFSSKNTQADVIIAVGEVGGNVVVSYSGSLDLDTLAFTTGNPTVNRNTFQNNANTGSAFLNAFENLTAHFYSDPFSSIPEAGWMTGVVPVAVFADSFSGNQFAVFTGGTLGNPLRLEAADITGTTWSGSGLLQFDSTTIAGIGLDLSVDRVWTINNSSAETITLTVVPEPGSIAFLVAGAIAGLCRRRR